MRRCILIVAAVLFGLAPGTSGRSEPSQFDGNWDVTIHCPATNEGMGAKGYDLRFPARVQDGTLTAQQGVEGTANSLRITGQIQPDGSALFQAVGRSGSPEYTVDRHSPGGLYGYPIKAQFNGSRGTGTRLKLRKCDFVFDKQSDKTGATAQSISANIAPTSGDAAKQAVKAPPRVRSDVDELPSARIQQRDKAYAVVIGIRRYMLGLPEADFADADATLMKTYLVKTLGYQDVNVVMLINERATLSGFEKFIESWLPNRVQDGAEVFVYFSGHGAPNPKTGDAYMVPYDGDPTYLDKTGYPLKRLYAELAKLPARKVTVVMDSCFSGAGGRSVVSKGARPLVMVSAGEGAPEKLNVISAAAGDQISYTYQDKGHGLFTYFFLRGIKEQAGKKTLDMKAVFDYAAPQVANTARREYNADQVPQWSGKH